jgi:hypothetical protein
MNKNDLKNGMTLILRNYRKRYIINNKVFGDGDDEFTLDLLGDLDDWLDRLDEDLKIKRKGASEYDIMRVLDCDNNVIWERREVDWSKISVDTKVLVRNSKYGEWHRRYFAKYEDGWVYCFDNGANSWNSNEISLWKYCKLAEEPSDKVTIEELDNQFKKSCGRQNCCNCDYESIDRECEFLWLMDNYNVTRKE